MLILCNIPTKFVTVGPRDPSYVTPLVRSLLNKRRRLRKRRRLDEANILAGKINLLIQQARSKELSKLSQATPKELWASVKNTTTNNGTSGTFPPHLFADIEFVNRHFSANIMQYIKPNTKDRFDGISNNYPLSIYDVEKNVTIHEM